MDVLFLTTRLDRPSYRFRALQFFPLLEQAGVRAHGAVLPHGHWKRWQFFETLRQFDVIVVQQRLLHSIELRRLRSCARRLVYDVDDAVMLNPDGRSSRRRLNRFRRMLAVSDRVVCGNNYLCDWARRCGGGSIDLIPTAVDDQRYAPSARTTPRLNSSDTQGRVVIGWTGSGGTNPYFGSLVPILQEFGDRIDVHVMSDRTDGLQLDRLSDAQTKFMKWSPDTEVASTAGFDIGVMPLPDNAWTRGKCGCKALQYMALGIPAVCSPVGVNCDIIDHGRTGFLAENPHDWRHILSRLVAESEVRGEVGNAGRERVQERYSVGVVGEQLVQSLRAAVATGDAGCAVSAAS